MRLTARARTQGLQAALLDPNHLVASYLLAWPEHDCFPGRLDLSRRPPARSLRGLELPQREQPHQRLLILQIERAVDVGPALERGQANLSDQHRVRRRRVVQIAGAQRVAIAEVDCLRRPGCDRDEEVMEMTEDDSRIEVTRHELDNLLMPWVEQHAAAE